MNWTCPICACPQYVSVTVARPKGGRYRTEFHRCASCTALFLEPELFSAEAIDAGLHRTAEELTKVPALAANLHLELASRYLRAKLKREGGGAEPKPEAVQAAMAKRDF